VQTSPVRTNFRDPVRESKKLRTWVRSWKCFPIIGKLWTTTTQALGDQVLKTRDVHHAQGERRRGGIAMVDAGHRAHACHQHAVDDEPDHKRLRDIVDEAFRRRAVLDMEPHIQAMGTNWPISCSQKASPPISSSAMRASCRCR